MRFDVLFIFSYSNLKPLLLTHKHMPLRVQMHYLAPTPFKCCPFHIGLASAFQLTLFLLQMTASTWEMSGSPSQRSLASSDICEVLSSSLQLRRAVSQESRLLTCNTAKTAKPSALKHMHSACSFASTKDCVSPEFVVFKAALSPFCRGSCIT